MYIYAKLPSVMLPIIILSILNTNIFEAFLISKYFLQLIYLSDNHKKN